MLALYLHSRVLIGRMVIIVALIMVDLLFAGELPVSAAARTTPSQLAELPLTFPIQSPEIAAYFNRVARADDIAAFPTPFIYLLPQVTAGQKMVFFRSWAEAERELADLSGQIELVGYNPEHWEHTPIDEQRNLPTTIQQAAEFAHTHGLRFVLAPDRRFTEVHLSQVAPDIDIIILQAQRLQKDPQIFAAWVGEMISIARAGNPQIQIYVQVGATQGPASEMLRAIQAVAGDIDGLAIWSMPRSFDTLQEFVPLIREDLADSEGSADRTASSAPTIIRPTETSTEGANRPGVIEELEPSTAISATSSPSPRPEQDNWIWLGLIGLVLLGGGLVIGLLIGFAFTSQHKTELQPQKPSPGPVSFTDTRKSAAILYEEEK